MSACNRETDAIVIDEALMAPTNGSNELDLRAETYDNAAFSDIDTEGASSIEGQWPTGIADPFIMRWNGMYYLYCTTSGLSNHGLRAWKSADLVHWENAAARGWRKATSSRPRMRGSAIRRTRMRQRCSISTDFFTCSYLPGRPPSSADTMCSRQAIPRARSNIMRGPRYAHRRLALYR